MLRPRRTVKHKSLENQRNNCLCSPAMDAVSSQTMTRSVSVAPQYGTEIRIHEAILSSPLHTKDPDKADLFFVPVYGECYLYRAAQQLGPQKGLDDTNGWFRNLTRILAEERPWWNRTQVRSPCGERGSLG